MANKIVYLSVLLVLCNGCFKTAAQMEAEKGKSQQSDLQLQQANAAADADMYKSRFNQVHGELTDTRNEVAQLKAENEALKKRVANTEEGFIKYKEETQKTLAQLVADVALLDERTSKHPEPHKEEKTPPGNPLEQARDALKSKDYKTMIAVTEHGLASKKAKNKDLLLFYQGLGYYKLKDYKKALISFNEIVENHKKSNKYKDAINLGAESFDKLGMKDEAKAYRSLLKDEKKK